ncbi:hypothetical protein MA16_Dca010462 [Dendrobium catenatum]|uniref:Uncharacterized protein n=1 Tax=Dendrobium catenatum TaxID=906689 RepID=A0A2I0XBN1_9ASPA|nr:hypothetical protein MA16_Dca010462 [Dendrobium catenatum]
MEVINDFSRVLETLVGPMGSDPVGGLVHVDIGEVGNALDTPAHLSVYSSDGFDPVDNNVVTPLIEVPIFFMSRDALFAHLIGKSRDYEVRTPDVVLHPDTNNMSPRAFTLYRAARRPDPVRNPVLLCLGIASYKGVRMDNVVSCGANDLVQALGPTNADVGQDAGLSVEATNLVAPVSPLNDLVNVEEVVAHLVNVVLVIARFFLVAGGVGTSLVQGNFDVVTSEMFNSPIHTLVDYVGIDEVELPLVDVPIFVISNDDVKPLDSFRALAFFTVERAILNYSSCSA